MIDVIFLVGGLGTRLRDVVSTCPKPLAPIRGRPFLDFLIDRIATERSVGRIVLATSYMSDQFVEHYKNKEYLISRESIPLGTGGAIKQALSLTQTKDVLILNGDSYLECSLEDLFLFHKKTNAEMTLCVREVEDVSRYGALEIDERSRIVSFQEKKEKGGRGWINGGVYLMKREMVDFFPAGEILSLEKECLPLLLDRTIFAYPVSGYFIDIGTKESYTQAQNEVFT